MGEPARLMEWFRDEPLPKIVPESSVIFGGTRLLAEFLSICSQCANGGQLAMAVPFVARGVSSDLPGLAALPHALVDLLLVTSSAADAASAKDELMQYPWKSIEIGVLPRLHAKVYSFRTAEGGGACLIGSHNLTRGGGATNHEAGVLLQGKTDPEVTSIIATCSEQVIQLLKNSEIVFDTLRYR